MKNETICFMIKKRNQGVLVELTYVMESSDNPGYFTILLNSIAQTIQQFLLIETGVPNFMNRSPQTNQNPTAYILRQR